MPEITVIHVVLLALMLVVGIVVGWATRSGRCRQEKIAINGSWQEQLSAQRSEHDRLGKQNKSLMEQVSQYQASNTDAKLRAKELSDAVKETFERRDELQRQIKDIRGNLEVAVTQRDRLQSEMASQGASGDAAANAIRERDQMIFKLSRELEGWQDRLPPLIERFRIRNEEARQLESDLADAHERIISLETMVGSDQTRVEPVDPNALTDGMDASNDPHDVSQEEGVDEQQTGDEKPADDFESAVDLAGEEDDQQMESLIENLHGTATNELLDNLDDLADVLSDDNEAAESASDLAGTSTGQGSNNAVRDNLKQIKGVGPAIEKTLNEMGIFRFDQIAEMSEYDIDRVAQRLKGFRSRIYREDWIGQARDLQRQKADGRL
jgi:predicted flap endonuclease-1-like 5' DNA nuclease